MSTYTLYPIAADVVEDSSEHILFDAGIPVEILDEYTEPETNRPWVIICIRCNGQAYSAAVESHCVVTVPSPLDMTGLPA